MDIKREALRQSFLHLDETSWYESGSLRWLWIVSHPSFSLFHVDPSRGRQVARDLLTDDETEELFQGIAVTDFYCAYRYMEGLDHQYCWPHLVRDARKFAEIDGGPLTEKFLVEMVSIYHDGKKAQATQSDRDKRGIRVRLGKLIASKEFQEHQGIARLQRRMHEEFHSLLTFLDVPDLPADNNQAYAARGISLDMPRPGLCRVPALPARGAGPVVFACAAYSCRLSRLAMTPDKERRHVGAQFRLRTCGRGGIRPSPDEVHRGSQECALRGDDGT